MSEVITTSTTDITPPTLTNEELTCKMSQRYVKAYQYIKDNNIYIFDENGN